MKKSLLFLGMALFGLSLVWGHTTSDSVVPSNEELGKILSQRLGDKSNSAGIIVGVLEPTGSRIAAYGSFAKEDPRPIDGNTVFEIGSITKVFTSLLLADMAQRGEVKITDPVAKYLPAGVKMPERNGHSITLEDLAKHRSGLPPLPANFNPSTDPQNPYARYTVKDLYEFLATYQLTRDIGAQFEYSNLGVGLLGHVLGLAAGKEYEALVRARILEPLGMRDTTISLSSNQQSRLAPGHDNSYACTPNWDLPTFAGAGALRSTTQDMLSFLEAQLGYKNSNLTAAITATRSNRTPAGLGMEIGLGWLIVPKKNSEVVWHNGGTGGYRTFVGFDPKARVGVVVLSNVSTLVGVDDIGLHLLNPDSKLLPPDSPLLQPTKERKEITLSSEILEKYIGQYQFAPNMSFTITRKDNQLFAQLTSQGAFEIYPENNTDFFARIVDAQILFRTDDQGRSNALVLRQNGQDQIAQRIDGNASPLEEWFGHRESKVDTAIFKTYVGRYQLAPGVLFTITLENNQLFAQLTGQSRIDVFPENARNFFYKVVDAQLTFESDGKNPSTALTLHQNNQNVRAPRIAK